MFSSRWLLTVCFLALGSTSALAQWQWLDSSGRLVFSDTPPPPEVSEKQIQKRPSAKATSLPPAADKAAAVSAQPKPAGRDDALEARKKQIDEAEQARAKAEADRVAQVRADNCDRARRAKATRDSGIRIASVNAKGEREILDDKARMAEARRLEDIIRSDCASPHAATQ